MRDPSAFRYVVRHGSLVAAYSFSGFVGDPAGWPADEAEFRDGLRADLERAMRRMARPG